MFFSFLFGLALSLDCNNLDFSIGASIEIDAPQFGYGYSYTGNIFDGEVACQYVSFNGFMMYYEPDPVTEVKVYQMIGTSNDYTSGAGDTVYACQVTDSIDLGTVEPDTPYNTIRSASQPDPSTCLYLMTVYSPSGSKFAYTIYTDNSIRLILNSFILSVLYLIL